MENKKTENVTPAEPEENALDEVSGGVDNDEKTKVCAVCGNRLPKRSFPGAEPVCLSCITETREMRNASLEARF